jgi:7-cyano-7-deazaguanine synthase
MHETVEEIRARVKNAQKNYYGNLKLLEGILQNEKGYVTRIPKNESVVLLYSGGLDSSILINKIIEDWNVIVHPLFIKRGARAEEQEEKSFDFFMEFYKKRFPDNMKEGFKLEYKVPPKEFKAGFPKELSLTQGLPLRNSTMQNLAIMYAVSLSGKGLDAKTIFTGSVADDNTEPEQGLLSLRAQTLNTCVQLGNWNWQITSPLTDSYLTERPIFKSDLIEYAMQKFIPLEKTRTCFDSEEIADGTCFACQTRLKAFDYLKIKDPLRYNTREIVK